MFKRIISASLIFGAAALAPPAATAQIARCMPRADLVQTLKSNYDEQLVGGGLQNPTQILEIWSSEKTGSFTVFITRADGTSCLISSGQNWSSIVEKMPEGVAG